MKRMEALFLYLCFYRAAIEFIHNGITTRFVNLV